MYTVKITLTEYVPHYTFNYALAFGTEPRIKTAPLTAFSRRSLNLPYRRVSSVHSKLVVIMTRKTILPPLVSFKLSALLLAFGQVLGGGKH